MKHLDEHMIELYVLGDNKAKDQRSIERHLRRCAGCRELEQQIRALYAGVEEELKSSTAGTPAPRQALARMERKIDLWKPYQPLEVQQPATAVTWWQRTRSMIRHRPVASIIGSFAFTGAIILSIVYSTTNLTKDKNPSYV